MKGKMKPVLFCLLFGLGIVLANPNTVAARQANTSTTYYLYDKDYTKYKDQTTLVVKENITDDYGYYLNVPPMKKITKIVFASTVKKVPENFFEKYPNVQEIQISKSFSMSRYVFSGLGNYKKLQTIKVASGNTKYKAKDNVLYTYNMKSIVVYPRIKKSTSYTMPSTVTAAVDAFGTNPYLKKITLSKNFTTFENYDFDLTKLPNLQTIAVASGNKKFKAISGVLFTYDKKTILAYPTGKKDTTYTVPSTVTKTTFCFGSNKYLKTLTLGKNVSSFIGTNMIDKKNLPNLTNIKVASGNKYFTTYNGALYTTGYKELVYCARGKVKPYTVKSGTKKIRFGAFTDCQIERITLPNGLTTIETGAFENTPVKELVLPASIKQLGDFDSSMKLLETVTVKDGCQNFYSIDGILYNKSGTIAAWPVKRYVKELSYPESCTRIDLKYFPNAKYVETLTIGKNVESITYLDNHLKKIVLDNENTSFKLYDGVLYNADYTEIVLYPNQNPDTTIELHENLKQLKQSWFSGSNNTTSLTLPAGLEKIITSYTDLQEYYETQPGDEIEYDYTCAEIDVAFTKSAFQNLKEISIASDNPYFTCEDNVVYNKDMTSLVWYPVNRSDAEYTLPDTVVGLNGQLREFKQLKQLTINNNVKSTLNYLGVYSDSLESIVVPSDNATYASLDGVLYSKKMDKMIVYPNGRPNTSYTMPKTVKDARFVWENKHLQKITLSPNLNSITQYPLLPVTLDDTVIPFPEMFSGFSALKTVNGLRDDIEFRYRT